MKTQFLHNMYLRFLSFLIISLIIHSLQAQLLVCPPGLTNAGVELITNGDFSTGNTGFNTDYTNNQASTWNIATYAISPNPNATHANFANMGDHTTGTGNMMVVNGAGTPNTNVWCQTFAVSPNTIYSFSAWVATIAQAPLASLQFEVNGVALGVPFNAPASSFLGWQQYANTWNSGAATSATICIINQNTASSGNDFAIDDISFQPCVCNLMNLQPTIQATTCTSSSTGSITVLVSGGAGPFSYSWNTTPASLTNVATNLGLGNYTFYVVDTGTPAASSCDTTVTYAVTALAPIQANISHTNATCAGGKNGTATAAPTGGSGAYSYSWATTPPQLTATATGLGAGTYTLFVFDNADAINCVQSDVVTILDGSPLVLTTTTTNTSCPAALNGSATVQATGGTNAYAFSWVLTPPQLTATASNLGMGTYTVFAADLGDPANCISSTTATVQANNFSLNLVPSVTKLVTCTAASDGSVTVQATGGSGAFTYSWATTPPQFTATATNLAPGTYNVFVADANGSPLCLQSTSIILGVGPALVLNPSVVKDVQCNGGGDGQANVQVSGGTGVYAYSWTSIPPQFSPIASNLNAGIYTIYVTDATAVICSANASVTITEPTALQLSTAITKPISCFNGKDGSITATALGGVSPYKYKWTPTNQTNATAINLGQGNYTVLVTDAHNCTISTTMAITQPTPLLVDMVEKHDPYCDIANGDITVLANNGTAPYSYSWGTTPPVLSAQVTNLLAGTQKVWVVDAQNCQASKSFMLKNTPPSTALFTTNPINTDTVLLSKAVFKLINQSTNAASYQWEMGDGSAYNSKNPTHTYYETGDFTITLISDNGYNACPDTFALQVHILPDGVIYVPNAFSPNQDGANDVFFVNGDGIETFDMVIFDRWGTEVAHLTSPKDKWDGTKNGTNLAEGVYVYKLGAKLNNGQRLDRSGTITLLR